MRVVKSFLISLVVLIALPVLLFGFVRLNGAKQATAHYSDREILRSVFESTSNSEEDAAKLLAARRTAFLAKVPEGTSRAEVYRKLQADRIGCAPQSADTKASKVECMTMGHSYDFRWHFVLYFGADDKLIDVNINTLKGA
jgi:hypothetical protein